MLSLWPPPADYSCTRLYQVPEMHGWISPTVQGVHKNWSNLDFHSWNDWRNQSLDLCWMTRVYKGNLIILEKLNKLKRSKHATHSSNWGLVFMCALPVCAQTANPMHYRNHAGNPLLASSPPLGKCTNSQTVPSLGIINIYQHVQLFGNVFFRPKQIKFTKRATSGWVGIVVMPFEAKRIISPREDV